MADRTRRAIRLTYPATGESVVAELLDDEAPEVFTRFEVDDIVFPVVVAGRRRGEEGGGARRERGPEQPCGRAAGCHGTAPPAGGKGSASLAHYNPGG